MSKVAGRVAFNFGIRVDFDRKELARQKCADCNHTYSFHDSRGCRQQRGKDAATRCSCPKFKRREDFDVERT